MDDERGVADLCQAVSPAISFLLGIWLRIDSGQFRVPLCPVMSRHQTPKLIQGCPDARELMPSRGRREAGPAPVVVTAAPVSFG